MTDPPGSPAATADVERPSAHPDRIRTESLWVWYRAFAALKGVSLRIPRGSVTALLGPSGCGKTTLLKALNRTVDLVPGARTRGKIWLDETEILAPRTDVLALRRHVALVTQEALPFPLSIFDNVAYGPRVAGIRDGERLAELVETSLRRASLWEDVQNRLRAPAGQLSGGQQRRLCVARALATQPEVLLMDEPTAMLDPGATSRIEDLIVELKRHYTVVVVTHNVQQAARISDVTAFVNQGELIETAATSELFTRPAHPQTEAYLTGRLE